MDNLIISDPILKSKLKRFYQYISNLPDIKAYYPLNEFSGEIINYAATTKGTLNGSATGAARGISGKIDKACHFDGLNDYATFPVQIPTNALTVGFLYRRRGRQDSNDRVLDWAAGGPSGGFEVLHPTANVNKIQLDIRNTTTLTASIASNEELIVNEFYFVCFTYSSNSVKFYIDGVLQGVEDTSVTMSDPSQTLTAMRRSSGSTNFSTGDMQHLFIVNGILNQATIQRINSLFGMSTKTPVKMQTLVDNFNFGGVDGYKWSNYGGSQVVAGENLQLELTSTTGAGYYGIDSYEPYDLTNSYAYIQVVDVGNQTISSFEFYPIHLSIDASNSISFMINGNNISAKRKISDTSYTVGTATTYNSSTMAWLRIRESNGITYWEYSSSSSGTWTILASLSNPIVVGRLKGGVLIGTWQSEVSTTTAIVNNFNVVSSGEYLFNWKSLNWYKRIHQGEPSPIQKWSPDNIYVDSDDNLVLVLTNLNNFPVGCEVYTQQRGFGYGTYIITTATRLDTLYPNIAFGGLYTFDFPNPPDWHEIDVNEVRTYGGNTSKQILKNHVYNNGGTREFITSNQNISSEIIQTHRMIWTNSDITFDSFIGDGVEGTNYFHAVHNTNIPTPDTERMHINIWTDSDTSISSDGAVKATPIEVKIKNVSFTAA